MKTLTDLKQPPIRVLKVQAGQTVAVQVNEQPAGPVARCRSEYRTASRRLVEVATWPAITLTEYIALRRVADRGTGSPSGRVGDGPVRRLALAHSE
jgi:hypothetical protein